MKFRKIGIIAGIILVILLSGYIYSTFFRPQYGNNNNITGILLLGLLLGGAIAALVALALRRKSAPAPVVVAESSHTVVESMKKVFKIVCAEGEFNELYNYEETKKLFNFIPNTKKALVIVQAKVLFGYDFNKAVWEMDEETKRVKIVQFPEPEILSTETDFKYYNMEENYFNMFSREDLQKIQQNAKKQVESAANNSNLKRFAQEQMKTLLTEVIRSNNWSLEDAYKITNEAVAANIPAFTNEVNSPSM